MGMFRQFPYTNFHDLNLNWVLEKIKELWKGVEDIDKKVDNFIIETEPTIRDEVDNWLDDHPEATTTVQDHSLTFEKMINGTMGYMFPAMFNVDGTGVNDDTEAFKEMFNIAVNEDKKIIIPEGFYNINENIFSDDTIVLFNHGTYMNKKIIVSKRLKTEFTPSLFKAFNVTNANITGALQGACYDSENDRVVIAYASEDTAPALIIAYDKNFNAEIISNVINPTSHFNDMAYNPDTHMIYVPARPTADTIYMINPDTLTVTDSFTIDFGGVIKRLSYDEINKLYYIQGDEYLKIYDSQFNLLHIVNYSTTALEADNNLSGGTILMQGSVVYNGQFLYLWCYQKDGLIINKYITQLNYSANTDKITYVSNTVTSKEEAEGIYTIGDKLYITSGLGRRLIIEYIDLCNNVESDTRTIIHNISDNEDVNNFMTPGLYICSGNATAQSLSNCPTALAFRLYVLPATSGAYLTQIYIAIAGDIFIRYYRQDTGLWYTNGQVLMTRSYGTSNNWHYEDFRNNYFKAFRRYATPTITNTAIGSLFLSQEITIPLPTINGTIRDYTLTAISNQSSWVVNPAISGSNLSFRIMCPSDYSGSRNVNLNLEIVYA